MNELQQFIFKSILNIRKNGKKILWEFIYVQFQVYTRVTKKGFGQGKNQRSKANFI